MPYPLLSGRVGALSPRSASTPIIIAVVVLGSVLGGLYIVARAPKADATVPPVAVVPAPAPAAAVAAPAQPPADLAFHVMSINAQLMDASEQIERAQRLVGGLVPDLTREGLWLERRRAEAAVAACENA